MKSILSIGEAFGLSLKLASDLPGIIYFLMKVQLASVLDEQDLQHHFFQKWF